MDRIMIGLALAAALMMSGCVQKSLYLKETDRANQLQSQNSQQAGEIQALRDQLSATQSSLDAAKAQNGDLMKSLDAKKGELAQRVADLSKQIQEAQQAKDEEIAKLKGSYDELVSGLKNELQAGQLTITQLKGRLSVNMVDKILFNSGQAQLKPEGEAVIARVGEVLKKVADKDIRIEGYTDNVPISQALRAKYPTNWELSTARATAVVRYLEEKAGVPKDRLIAAGFGENNPVATNETAEGRQQNRRIEIVLVPRIPETAAAPTPKSGE